ncbi:MAG: cytochrome C oxidase subunit III [Sulfurovum sp.]|nr:cytochrome C oxidase subunit III [Sulfurovum sp.]
MNSFIVKGLVFAAILMITTLVVVWKQDIDLSDPVNLITMIGALAIAALSFGVSAKYLAQIKSDSASGELTGENWDGIGKYKNELPAGWTWSFMGIMVWGMWYFFFSPYTLGAYSQIGEWNEEVKAHSAKFEEKYKNADAETLQEMGESIYLVQCAPCHGINADGMDGKAQDLTVPIYKGYGIEGLSAAIKYGKTAEIGTMPAFENMMTDVQLKAVSTYIMSLSK